MQEYLSTRVCHMTAVIFIILYCKNIISIKLNKVKMCTKCMSQQIVKDWNYFYGPLFCHMYSMYTMNNNQFNSNAWKFFKSV